MARLTQLEFLDVGGRLDRLEKKTDDGFKSVVDLLDLIRGDVHDMKITLGPLTRKSVRYLNKRVARLELPGGNHNSFLFSQRAEVIEAMRSFPLSPRGTECS